MRPLFTFTLVIAFALQGFPVFGLEGEEASGPDPVMAERSVVLPYSDLRSFEDIYANLHEPGLSYRAFLKGLAGMHGLSERGMIERKDIVTIIDFSLPSTVERMFIIDLNRRKVILKTFVSHGQNSGDLFAVSFSNVHDSFQSSLGFFRTSETYFGKHGYSLRLDGLEREINDNAKSRHIVVHGAPYANESYIEDHGLLGTSLGCPAVPTYHYEQVITLIKGGSCLFIYAPDESYRNTSNIPGGLADLHSGIYRFYSER